MRIDFQVFGSFSFKSTFIQRRILHHKCLRGSEFSILIGAGFKCLVNHLEKTTASVISDRHPVLKPNLVGQVKPHCSSK